MIFMKRQFMKHPIRNGAFIGAAAAGLVGLVYAGRWLFRRGKEEIESGLEDIDALEVVGEEGASENLGATEDESYDTERTSRKGRRRGRQPEGPELH